VPIDDHAQTLREAITDLTERFAHPTTLEDTLAGITAAAVNLLPSVDSVDVLIITDPDQHRSIAATSPLAIDLDQLQRRHRQGPCLDAAVGETMVVSNDLRDDPRWPQYSASALQVGVHATLSFQLYTHQQRPTQRAAFNLFSRQPDAFDPEAQAVAAMLATHAAITLIAQHRDTQFQSALASRDAIGQAKGMIMERFDVDAQRAFELLKKLSQDGNVRLMDIAAQIVAGGPHR
jgi:GAF domain-containing protein